MKILNIISSARKQGNTAQIVTRLQETLISIGSKGDLLIEFDTINLSERYIQPCRGCRVCFDRGEVFCPLKDDLLQILEQIRNSDVIIVASPVYVNDVNGIMKNLIDRLAFICHRPELGNKMVYLIATVGGSISFQALLTLSGAFSTWGAQIIGKTGFVMGELMKKEEIIRLYESKIQKIGKLIIKAIQKQAFLTPSMISLITFKIQQKAWGKGHGSSADLEYWKQQGWLDPHCTFYVPMRTNRVKLALARMIGSIFATFLV